MHATRNTVDLSGIHPSFRAEIAAEATRLQSLWTPPLYLSVGAPDSRDPRTGDAMAWTDNQDAPYAVTLNAGKYGRHADAVKTRAEIAESVSEHFSFETSPADILTHEYGHVLHGHLSDREKDAFASELLTLTRLPASTPDEWYGAVQFGSMVGAAMFKPANYRRLSMYGVEGGPFEAMAEAFAALNKRPRSDAARIAAKYIGKFHR
jgi:hypothetical protein